MRNGLNVFNDELHIRAPLWRGDDLRFVEDLYGRSIFEGVITCVKSPRDRIVVLDHALVDEDPLRSTASVDLDGVVGAIHGINDETVGKAIALEKKVCDLLVELFLCAVKVADDAGVLRRFGIEGGIVEGRLDMVRLEVEVLEGWIGRSEDMGLQFEVARSADFVRIGRRGSRG